jgi:hypothetical protein
MRDGGSLYDALGPGYTLLRFDPAVAVAQLQAAAAHRRMPLEIVDVDVAAPAYDRSSRWYAPISTLPGAATRCPPIWTSAPVRRADRSAAQQGALTASSENVFSARSAGAVSNGGEGGLKCIEHTLLRLWPS